MKARYLFWLIPALCVAVALWWDNGGQHWAAGQTGTYCGSTGPRYCYWSGFGSVFPWVLFSLGGVFTAIALFWRNNTCQYSWWCWRHPYHPLEGNEHYKLCSRHHPDDHMSVKEAVEHHIRLRRQRAGQSSASVQR